MEIDKVIKKSLDSKAEAVNLSSEKSAGILDFIEREGNKEREKLRVRITNGIFQLIRKPYFSEIAEVAVFVLVLVLVPLTVKHFGNALYSKGSINNPVQVNDSTDRKDNTKEIRDFIAAEQTKIIEQRTNRSEINEMKTENVDGVDEIKKRCPFEIEYPDYLPQGYKLKSLNMRIQNDDLGNIYTVFSLYTNPENKQVNILQATETGKPGDLFSGCEKISINGKDAWIKDDKNTKNDLVQIMLWKNGEYYNVMSSDIGREELIKIAQSLDFTITTDTRQAYRKGTVEFYENMDEVKAKVSFEIDYPKYLPKDYGELKASLRVITIDNMEVHMLFLNYASKEKVISILEMEDAGKLQEILKRSTKIDISGTEGWLYEPTDTRDSMAQVIFWKNGKFYDIWGDRMEREELIKVAKSL